jgi:hypothetical protein
VVFRRFYSPKRPFSEIPAKKTPQQQKHRPEWVKRDIAIKQRYGQWNPTKRLSRKQMDDVRSFLEQAPHLRTVDLAHYFKVSPEAIRRILASKWVPKESEEDEVLSRDNRRKERNKHNNVATELDLHLARTRLAQGRSKDFDDIAIQKTSRQIPLNSQKRSSHKKKYQKRKQLVAFHTDIADTID